MDKDIADMMKKFSDMISDSSSFEKSSPSNEDKIDNTFDFSRLSPESLSNFAKLFQSSNNGTNNLSNFDINTVLKVKSIMNNMNSTPDPRCNLLKSLKPYLRESKQSKVDQYINLFSMSKLIEAFKESGGNAK